MDVELFRIYTNALVVLLSFEKYWMLNNKSKGKVYKKEAKAEALKVCSCIERLYQVDKFIMDSKALRITDENGEGEVREILSSLKDWGANDEDYLHNNRKYFAKDARMYIQVIFMSLESYIANKLSLCENPLFSVSGAEYRYEQLLSEWYGQVHPKLLDVITPPFVTLMNDKKSIAVVADVRRSQDLMTYSSEKDTYSVKIREFIANAQQMIIDNNGIFDKFTGDGFIAYFNEELSKEADSDFLTDMLNACHSIMPYSNSYFEDWKQELTKVPTEPIGLTIGVDMGSIYFSELNRQIMAVGEACIWATRACAAGHKGELVINNRAYQALRKARTELEFETRGAQTKTGEEFECHVINLLGSDLVNSNK